MAKIFAVTRISSKPQEQGQGIEVQENDIISFAKSIPAFRNYEIVIKKYTQSSTEPKFLKDRPDLLDILDSLQEGDIPAYWNMERLSRNEFVRGEFIQHLLYGKKITQLIVGNKIYDLENGSDKMMLGIYSTVTGKQTSEDIERRVKAKRNLKKEGYFTGHMLPYGYKTVTKGKRRCFEIDEEKAKIYHKMVDWYLEGKSARDICLELNRIGIPTAREGQNFQRKRILHWQNHTLLGIFHNPFYLGKDNDKNGITGVSIPSLITKQKRDLLLRKLKENRRATHRRSIPNKFIPLKNLLTCSRCGKHVIGRISWIDRKKYGEKSYWHKSYACYNRYIRKEFKYHPDNKKCDLPPINADLLFNKVWFVICQLMKSKDTLKSAISHHENNSFVNKLEIETKILSLEKEINFCDNAIKRLLTQYASGKFSEKMLDELSEEHRVKKLEFEKQTKILKTRLSDKQHFSLKIKELEKILIAMSKNLDNFNSKEEKDKLIRLIVNEIVLGYNETTGWDIELKGDFDLLCLAEYQKEIESSNHYELNKESQQLFLRLVWMNHWKPQKFIVLTDYLKPIRL
ncbi:MAG: recombinase family protein [Candidatus Omnitrophota bacterium]